MNYRSLSFRLKIIIKCSKLVVMNYESVLNKSFFDRLGLIYQKVVNKKIKPSTDNVIAEKGWLSGENFKKLRDLKDLAMETMTPKDYKAYFEFAVKTGSENHFEEALKFLGSETNYVNNMEILNLLLKGYSNSHEHYKRTIKYKVPVGYDPKEKLNNATKRYWETFSQINSLKHSTALKVKV